MEKYVNLLAKIHITVRKILIGQIDVPKKGYERN